MSLLDGVTRLMRPLEPLFLRLDRVAGGRIAGRRVDLAQYPKTRRGFVGILWILGAEIVVGLVAVVIAIVLTVNGMPQHWAVWFRSIAVLAITATLLYFAWRASLGLVLGVLAAAAVQPHLSDRDPGDRCDPGPVPALDDDRADRLQPAADRGGRHPDRGRDARGVPAPGEAGRRLKPVTWLTVPGNRHGPRAVAQLGSAPDWGSGGRKFKSCQPDQKSPDETEFSSGLQPWSGLTLFWSHSRSIRHLLSTPELTRSAVAVRSFRASV